MRVTDNVTHGLAEKRRILLIKLAHLKRSAISLLHELHNLPALGGLQEIEAEIGFSFVKFGLLRVCVRDVFSYVTDGKWCEMVRRNGEARAGLHGS